MSEKNWKLAERRIAKFLGDGAKRIPVTGRNRGDAPDISHPFLSIEHKYRQDFPNWLETLAGQKGKDKSVLIDGFVVTKLEHFMEFVSAAKARAEDALSVLFDADYPNKLDKEMPDWIMDAVDQAIKSKRGTQCPVVIISRAGRTCNRSILLVDREDAKELVSTLREYGNNVGVGTEPAD